MRVFFSNRIYKRDLDISTVSAINKLIGDYSSILHFAYKEIVSDARYGPDVVSLYFRVENKYPDVLTYIRNTAIQDAKGIHTSRMQLLKEQKSILQQKLSNTKRKLEKTMQYRDKLLKHKQLLIDGKELVFDNKQQTFKKTPNGCIKVYKGKGKNRRCICTFDNAYLFECLYLQPELNKLKSRIGLLTFKINKLQFKLDRLNNVGFESKYISAVQFGSKKLRKQGLTNKLKQQEYEMQRNCQFSVSGRNDSINGNFVFNYDTTNNSLSIKTGYKNQCIVIDNVVFRHGQEIINNYYLNQYHLVHSEKKKGKPIAYTVEDKGLYYIIKCSLEEDIEITNYCKTDGVIGIDCNLGFFSICETNESGSPLLMRDMVYEWKGKTTNQVKYNIEQQVKEIVLLANSIHKPIVIERLKLKGKGKLKDYNSNNSKNFNRNMFAYHKMVNTLMASAKRNGIEVYEVDAMYTSLIGKEKYQPYYKRSIHQMAALAIARRAMYTNRTESIPNKYKNCSSWQEVYKIAKKNK